MSGPEELPTDSARWRAQYDEIAALAGGLAHEIRNPLSTISLNLELIDEELAESATPQHRRLRQKLQTIQRECGHLEQIVEEFLQFARTGTVDLQPVVLNDLVTEFLEIYRPTADEKRVELMPHLAAQIGPTLLDRGLFRQALVNLSRNAVQAMPNGGRLEFFTYERDHWAVLELIDNGAGMDAATQARMFDAFFSTKNGGSGLGLPTVRKIVLAHGGEIDCQSALGKGTRFRLRFPLINATRTDGVPE